MIPKRSVIGKFAKSVFYKDVNDIDVYIEDTAFGYEKIYHTLLSRLFKGKYKIEKVFPLGGRKDVIESFRSHIRSERPYLYIVDGDLFLAIGEDLECQAGLYKLPCYCIENILCDPEAFVDIMNEEDPVIMKEDLKRVFNFENWKKCNGTKLFELFTIYSLTFKYLPEVQTVSFPVNRMVSSDSGDLDEVKYIERIEHLIRDLKNKLSEDKFETELNYIKDLIKERELDVLDVVSGKDYIYPLLRTRVNSLVDNRVPHINFKNRLAMKCCLKRIECCIDFIAS